MTYSREVAIPGRVVSRRDRREMSSRESRGDQRETPVYDITSLKDVPKVAVLDSLRIDVSMPFLAHLVAALEQYGAEVNVNLRAPREGPQKGYGTLTVRFPPNAGA